MEFSLDEASRNVNKVIIFLPDWFGVLLFLMTPIVLSFLLFGSPLLKLDREHIFCLGIQQQLLSEIGGLTIFYGLSQV